MSSYSFYGGNQGQNFSVSAIFENKIALMADLEKRWSSSIGVGEYVFISYGAPNRNQPIKKIENGVEKYYTSDNVLITEANWNYWIDNIPVSPWQKNTAIDVAAYGVSNNMTLWRKIFKEDSDTTDALTGIEEFYISEDFGIGYQMVAALASSTPVITFDDTEALDANKLPFISVDYTSIDNPVFTLHLPQSQVLQKGTDVVLNADEMPSVTLDNTDINKPVVTFSLPQSQVLQNKTLDTNDSTRAATNTIENTNAIPYVTEEYVDNSINKPYFHFHLPKPIEYIYGEDAVMVSPDTNGKIITNKSNLNGVNTNKFKPGDYYIHKSNGNIYLVTDYTDDIYTFEFKGCMARQLDPDSFHVDSIDAYSLDTTSGQYVPATPTGSSTMDDDSWVFRFGIPTAPTFTVAESVEWVAPTTEQGELPSSINASIVPAAAGDATANEYHYDFNFTVPRGARWYGGSEIQGNGLDTVTVTKNEAIIKGLSTAMTGDMYLFGTFGDSDDGDYYQLTEIDETTKSQTWTKRGNIKGDVGKAINIVGSIVYRYDADAAATTKNAAGEYVGPLKIDSVDSYSSFGDLGKEFLVEHTTESETETIHQKSDELITITYIKEIQSGEETIQDAVDYWLLWSEFSGYQIVKITGSIGNAIEKEKDVDGSDEKVYSTKYINTVIDEINEHLVDTVKNEYDNTDSTENVYSTGYINSQIGNSIQETIKQVKGGVINIEGGAIAEVTAVAPKASAGKYSDGTNEITEAEYNNLDDTAKEAYNVIKAYDIEFYTDTLADGDTAFDDALSNISESIASTKEELEEAIETVRTTVTPVEYGGTGVATIAKNGLVIGDDANAVKTVAANNKGVLVASAKNATPQFIGPALPLEYGGTGGSTATAARTNLDVYSKSEIATLLTDYKKNITIPAPPTDIDDDSYEAPLRTEGVGYWSYDSETETYTYSISLVPEDATDTLHKIKDTDAPPMIICIDSNTENYGYMSSFTFTNATNYLDYDAVFTKKITEPVNLKIVVIR